MELKNCYYITVPNICQSSRGNLIYMEAMRHVPFAVKRVYLIKDMDGDSIVRGQHAHKKTEQLFFCIHGTCTFLADDGTRQEEIFLAKENVGIYIGIHLWHSMQNFSRDCILLVLASEYYDEADYIRNYKSFLQVVNASK